MTFFIIWYVVGLYGALAFLWPMGVSRTEAKKYSRWGQHAPIWQQSGIAWILAALLAFAGPLPLIAALVTWLCIVMDKD